MQLQFELFDNKKEKVKPKVIHEPSKIIESRTSYLTELIEYTNDNTKYTWYGTFTDKQEIKKGLNGENYFITIHGATWLEARKFMLNRFKTKFKQVLRHEDMDFKNKKEYLSVNLLKQNLLWCL